MRKLLFLLAGLILISGLSGCRSTVLNGYYVDVWDFNREGDAVSTFEFFNNGDVTQNLKIDPAVDLDFEGVDDTEFGEYEVKNNTLKIILKESSYEMQIIEKTKEYIIFGVIQADGTVSERKFIKE